MAPVSLGRMWNHLGEGIVGLLSKNLLNKGMMVGDLTGVEKKEFIHVVLAEANTKRRDGGGQSGCFITNGTTQKNGRLVLKSPNSSKACRFPHRQSL